MLYKKKVLLVCSPYYKEITDNLILGASKVFEAKNIEYKILNVPGALEIAPAIKLVYEKSKENSPPSLFLLCSFSLTTGMNKGLPHGKPSLIQCSAKISLILLE